MLNNRKVIVLCGFEHGGTSLVWNLITSHPQVCSPIYETGELFRRSEILRTCRYQQNDMPLAEIRRQVDTELTAYKLCTLSHPFDKYRVEDVLYTSEEVAAAALCMKSVNDDILLMHLLTRVYPNLYIIGLARSGYALCEGYARRGKRITEASRTYQRVAKAMQRLSQEHRNFKLIHFEAVLADPFAVAEDLFHFLRVHPTGLDKIRLKSKKTLKSDGEHEAHYGHEHKKYWFDRENIAQALAPDIDRIQASRLTELDRAEIDRVAGDAMRFFGYESTRPLS